MKYQEPSPDLYHKITSRIEYEKRLKKLKIKLVVYACVTAVSSLAFTFLAKEFSLEAKASGFLGFLSLLFSDFKVISGNIFDYVLSVVDSLPVVSFGLVSMAVLFMLGGAIKILNYLLEFKKLRETNI